MKRLFAAAAVTIVSLATTGCGTGENATVAEDFATSGSAAADQRAEQQVAKEAQIEAAEGAADDDGELRDKTLFVRLGAEDGVALIVDDAVDRALADPRVNARRQGIEDGWFTDGVEPLKLTEGTVKKLKEHLADFIAVAAGGPVDYEGPGVAAAFSGLQFTNIEFDAAVGDLQATLDKLGFDDQEQKELLAIIETTRELVVEVR